MDMLECVKSRRTISVYKNTPLPDDALEKILESASWTPSGANSQPVEYIVVREKASLEKIREHMKEVLSMSNVDNMDTIYKVMEETGTFKKAGTQKVTWDEYLNPPVMVIVVSNEDLRGTEYEDYHHYTMVAQSAQGHIQTMMLAAHALGVGSMWCKYFDPERIKIMFEIPKTFCVAGIVLLGYAKYIPRAPELALSSAPELYPRRPLENMLHEESFNVDKWIEYQFHDPWRLPRKEFIRTEKYVRPTKLAGKRGK